MLVTAFNFVGIRDNSSLENVNIYFDTETFDILTGLQNGGFTSIMYQDTNPHVEPGAAIYSYDDGTNLHTLHFQLYYPFAYDVVSSSPDPVKPTTPLIINDIITSNQSSVGVNDGKATINISGGTPEYNYSINSIDYQASNFFNDLPPGLYNISVKDSQGAIIVGSFTIESAPFPPSPPVKPPEVEIIALSDAEIEIQNAYKRVKVLSKFGSAPSVITNGDFQIYDGQNWEFWVKYGNINVSRVQRSVKNNLGVEVPIENYAIRFNERAQQSRYIQHSDIPVQKGDTLKIEYRVGNTPGTGVTKGVFKGNALSLQGNELDKYNIPAEYNKFYISKIRIKVGPFYLYNPDYGNSYEWVNQVATVSHRIDNPQGDLSNYLISFSIPDAPVTGSIVIQLFGFQQIQTVSTQEFRANSFLVIPPLFFSQELPEYIPVDFDDISASKSSQNTDNDIEGILSISDNLRFYSQTPNVKELLFGDFFYRQNFQQPLDNLYAIKYNGEYTSGWYEYLGGSSKTVPFGMGLSKSILTAYQKPFRKWFGNIKLKDGAVKSFSYMDIFSFNVPGSPSFNRKQFAVLGGSINPKNNTFENVTLVEIFDRAARSNDNTVPSYPNMPDPVFVQDPNSVIGNGIFTEEFTQEFV